MVGRGGSREEEVRGEGEKSKGREGDERRYVCREGEEGVGRERRE